MGPLSTDRWERARREMVSRWKLILEKVEARDEGGVLALANMMDEFCEVAVEERKAAAGDRKDPAVPVLKFPPEPDISGRCAFCRAFTEIGGCFGLLHSLNKAVLERRWPTARRVAEEHLERLEALRFSHSPADTVH